MNKKTLFLVITLIAMLILVTSVNAATDNTNTSTTHSISEKTTTTEHVVKEKIENTPTKEKTDKTQDKKITKTNKKRENTKTTQVFEVNNYNELSSALNTINSDTEYDEYLINFNEGTYTLTEKPIITTEKNIIINGNYQTISGKASYRINITANSITINNLNLGNIIYLNALTTLNNFTSTKVTHIYDNSNITQSNLLLGNYAISNIYNSTITQGFLFNESILTCYNTTLDGKITNEGGTIVITDDCTIGSNFIYNYETNTGTVISNITGGQSYDGNMEVNNENINREITIPETGNITFNNCIITNKITNNGNITLINCSLSNNAMTTSGSKTDGFLIENNGNLNMIDCVMENNTFNITSSSSNMNLYGAIVNNGFMIVENSTFKNNKIGYHGLFNSSGFYYLRLWGNAPVIYNQGTLKINDSNFIKNFASSQAGAIISQTGNLSINNSVFKDNHANQYGGAIIIGSTVRTTYMAPLYAQFNIENTLFTNNSAYQDMVDGRTYIPEGITLTMVEAAHGGAIYTYTGNGTINNCTFQNTRSTSTVFSGTTGIQQYHVVNITNSLFQENNTQATRSPIALYNYYSTYYNIINNTFTNHNNTCVIYNSAADTGGSGWTDYKYQEQMINNTFKNNNVTEDTITYSPTTYGTEPKGYNKTVIKNGNQYINTTLNDKIELIIPDKIIIGEPITITGTYTLAHPEYYDEDILEQTTFNVYVNGRLNQTIDTIEFDITPTSTANMIITVESSISHNKKSASLKPLANVTITPENYDEYIYNGNLIGVSRDAIVLFKGEFQDKGEILIDTSDIIIDGTSATFTNTTFSLEASRITLENLDITNTQTGYVITNTADNNIITNNTIRLTNNEGKTSAIYNKANNTEISYNNIYVDGPALDIDYTDGYGVANTQAILLLGGDNNIIKNNNIQVTSISISGVYGTVEGITNHNQANHTQITNNNIQVSGNAKFNYAINSLSYIENIIIQDNNIIVTGERYTAGIQVGNGAENISITRNQIKCTCQNTTPVDEEAITYGIITTNMGSSISNNIGITYNTIDLKGSVNYGIEVYQTNNTWINFNNITVTGLQSMGIGYAHSPNSQVYKNIIKTSGDSTIPLTKVTEEIQQANTGIQIQQDSNNIRISFNTIQTYDKGAQDTCINVETNKVTIYHNNLTSSTKTGDQTINTQPDTTLEQNTAIIQESTTQTTTEDLTTGDNTTLTAQFYDDTYTPIGDGKAIFKVNGKTLRDNQGNVIYADVINGRAELPDVNITQEWTKEGTTIQAVYIGDDNNEPITTTPTTITVAKPEATITLDTPSTATAGQEITLKATVTDGDTAIISGRVAFKLNGKTLKDPKTGKAIYANVENGVATITYTIPEKTKAKTYNLTAVFTDTAYDRKEASAELVVAKA